MNGTAQQCPAGEIAVAIVARFLTRTAGVVTDVRAIGYCRLLLPCWQWSLLRQAMPRRLRVSARLVVWYRDVVCCWLVLPSWHRVTHRTAMPHRHVLPGTSVVVYTLSSGLLRSDGEFDVVNVLRPVRPWLLLSTGVDVSLAK